MEPITTEFLLTATLVIYLVIFGIGYLTKNKYFLFAGSLLWFVPVFHFTDMFIITVCIIVFILHLMIVFMSDKNDSFE